MEHEEAGRKSGSTIWLVEEVVVEAPALYADGEDEITFEADYAFDTSGVDLGGLADPNQPRSDNPYDSRGESLRLCALSDTLT